LVTYIPKADLIVGRKYRCLARNFEIGVWNGTGFDYMRYKFGHAFPDVEYHYDDGAPYGTVRPLEIVNE
jgi:hypothetical protein